MLVEVGPAVVPEIVRVGLLGWRWLNALAIGGIQVKIEPPIKTAP
jgi:hypothetical protein